MDDSTDNTAELVGRAGAGDVRALAEVLERNRQRLKRMVRIRLDTRLRGRLDPSDVIQEAYLDAARRLPEYVREPAVPFFLWLRKLTAQRLIDVHRQHLGAKMRDAGLEVSLHYGAYPQASSLSLAAQLLERYSSPSQAAMRAELQVRVQEALNTMDPIDREVLVLRHFEMLTNEEVAQVLGVKKTAASNRYIRALKRLTVLLESFPDLKP
ncbi:MAG: sigma-70 family RNA polymerase sigma factor [Pirellulales bacterium]